MADLRESTYVHSQYVVSHIGTPAVSSPVRAARFELDPSKVLALTKFSSVGFEDISLQNGSVSILLPTKVVVYRVDLFPEGHQCVYVEAFERSDRCERGFSRRT